jgi:hypothetical protein
MKKTPPQSSYFLGTFASREWLQPKNLHTYELPWSVKKGAVRLHKLLVKAFDDTPQEDYDDDMKKPKKPVYDREYFIKMGKQGQKKVKAMYGKSSVEIRWEASKKLSPKND